MSRMAQVSAYFKHYLLITGNYWGFTLTDGALRMMVLLYFCQLGYSPLEIASLFLFYEAFGVITNLVGGWLGARIGLNRIMNFGLGLQIVALLMLTVTSMLSVPYVMAAQALSGIAKDLNKMSAKSSVKLLAPAGEWQALYRLVALLTGSKNALKGVGFFLGGALLATVGFTQALYVMAAALLILLLLSVWQIRTDLGKAKVKPQLQQVVSKNAALNWLSVARLFLFGARDVWFVVALPLFFKKDLGWEETHVGTFFAVWIIGYGIVQALAPKITRRGKQHLPDGSVATVYALILSLFPFMIALALTLKTENYAMLVLLGFAFFGFFFAINASLHSYLVLRYAGNDRVALDVGFYYMANAMGRLLGTVLSGALYQIYGLTSCLWVSFSFILIAALCSTRLPKLQ